MSEVLTTLLAVRAALIIQIKTIVPRHEPRRAERWRWVGDLNTGSKVGGPGRSFDLIPDIATEVPGGAYGNGIQYSAELTIAAMYDRWSHVEFALAASDDGADLAALLVRAHTAIPGMLPIETEGRSDILLRPVLDPTSTEARQKLGWVFTVNFWASDTVATE